MKQKQVLEIIYDDKTVKVRRSWFTNFLYRIFRINRKHKDRLFIKVFSDKNELLKLYNAVNHSCYTNAKDLIITTLEDAVYMGMKNDCSFLIGNYLNLYEHQSTFNPNMPLRGLLYFAGVLQGYLAVNQMDIYGENLIKIPTPKYVVFYNGTDTIADRVEMKLSDAFENPGGCMEFTAVMLNINLGHNKKIMEQCRLLEEYAIFIEQIRGFQNKGYDLEDAIDVASEYCIEHDVLKKFLLKNRNEVRQLILTEYDAKKHMAIVAKNALERGREEGRKEEKNNIARKLRKQGLPVSNICELTGLSEEEILLLEQEEN
ncbi:RpnC/YadD family protein [Hespellia stercorisuis]|uniref:Transposase (putative) YhgA-like domain-containing protein n=1 Tax=Hespellia stercorisuis DSM 15480 TaxID=1121950 RepID=A0A1M6JMG2_9FIRM|nr:hypothetical protein [Hespellia stercorisuis]SHJ47905.1 conserved hypothetical protein (putative transposase or invertase) [Hespellia stercorisuis DSM 15480]